MNVSITIPSFRLIGKFELPLLIAVVDLGINAYGKFLAEELSSRLGRNVTVGQVSRSLNSLLKLGIVERRTYLPDKRVKGQRSRLVYSLTEKGRKLLHQVEVEENSTARTGNADSGPPFGGQGELMA